MDFTRLFEIQGILFSVMVLGLLFRKKGAMKEQGQELLTDLVVHVTLPYSIVRSPRIEFDHKILVNRLIIPTVALRVQVGSYILSFVLYPHTGERRKEVFQYATICSNAGTLGNPIAGSIFSPLGPLYASMYLIPQRVFVWLTESTYSTKTPGKRTLVKKATTHPCVLAAGLGPVPMISGIRLLSMTERTVKTLASANTALSMPFIGNTLAGVSFRFLWNHVILYYSLIRLIFIPCLTYLFCLTLHVEPVITGISVVLAGMPVTSVTAILVARYKCDVVFMAGCVASSTLLLMMATPALCLMIR